MRCRRPLRGVPRKTGGNAKLGKIQTALLGSIDPVSTAFTGRIEALRIGNGLADDTDIGPLMHSTRPAANL